MGNADLLLKLGEGREVGALVLLEEFEHLLDLLGGELRDDRVEVARLVLPEFDLNHWIWMVSRLEGALWVLLEDALDLLGPVDNGV